MKFRYSFHAVLVAVMLALIAAGCAKRDEAKPAAALQVVTSLFPLYDFARAIAGDRARVTLLMPPGVEPHTFEPKPEDMVTISRAGIFIYSSRHMEPWAAAVVKGVDSAGLRVVEAGGNLAYHPAVSSSGHDEGHDDRHHGYGSMDPHIWLDFSSASAMVDAILAGFVSADAGNSAVYRANADALKSRLALLDGRFREGLASCETRNLFHAGHYTFGYLSRRYNLDYHALSGVSSDSEPSASRMAALIRQVRSSGARYIFAEELLSPRIAATLAREAGVRVLTLNGAHNLSRDEFARGATFFDLMEKNLVHMREGLQCREK